MESFLNIRKALREIQNIIKVFRKKQCVDEQEDFLFS